MSFSGTPLGQGRRLDHRTFLNKPNSNSDRNNPRTTNPPTSPQHTIPTSYSYGAPTAATRSPSKPISASLPEIETGANTDEPALVRYARAKQLEQLNIARPGAQVGPRIITSPPQPDKWSVKDTSVNIATAFMQAASNSYDMLPNNPNNSWASGSQPNLPLPRSTSVEYEKETQSTINRRLAPPPDRLAQRMNRKPLSKQMSTTQVPGSEGEDEPVDENGRAKTPFEHVVELAGRAASFYLRQRSREPEDRSNVANGKDSSYDYSAEEREYQELQQQAEGEQGEDQGAKLSSRKGHTTHRRNRMSVDNKAYRPSPSDLEESDEEGLSDDGRKRRRRTKKGGGPLTSLPTVVYDKRKKRKTRGNKGEEDQENSASDSEQRSAARESVPRTSAPPPVRQSVPRESIPRGSVPPLYHETSHDDSMDVETGLHSIPEELDDPPLVDGYTDSQKQASTSRSFSIGGLLGKLVNRLIRGIVVALSFMWELVCAGAMLVGKVLGTIADVVFQRPAEWISHANPGPIVQFGKYLMVAASLYAAWYALQDPLFQWMPSRGSLPPAYHAPDTPIADLSDLIARLQNIESALSGLSFDHQRARSQQDVDARSHAELINRLFALETRVKEEANHFAAVEHLQTSARQSIQEVRKEVEMIQLQVQSIELPPQPIPAEVSDEEAREKLKVLEERLGDVEGGVKEALELGKNSVQAGAVAASAGAAWWNKLTSSIGKPSGITIKSTDGQDITSLIDHLVDSTVLRYSQQDIISRADFALHSAGARLVPSLTSDTLQITHLTYADSLYNFFTQGGKVVGRSPVTAIHHESQSGYCWPMEGTKGSLGVILAAPALVSDITIDHVPKEVAFDLRSAPKDMEVWGLVEGEDNLARLQEWEEEKAQRREEAIRTAEEAGVQFIEVPEPEYPSILPKVVRYIRIASFSYDIHSSRNIQTFPVFPEIRQRGFDFGLVVLFIDNNWGQDEFTCLYRFRVHGEMLPPSLPPSEESTQS